MQALLWLDAETTRYWAFAWLCFGATVFAALAPAQNSGGATPPWNRLLFGALVLLTLAAFRWPVWLDPAELNPDESQTIAGAITLAKFPVYWRDVDGTTHGPFCEYFLLLAHWLGAPLNFVTARVVTTVLQALATLATWGALRRFMPERVARAGVLPALAFWAFIAWDDFVHYSSELPGILFFALAVWLAALALTLRPGTRQRAALFGCGVFLGALPFAKLQIVPLGLVAAGLLVVMIWRGAGEFSRAQRIPLVGALVAGGVLVPVGVAVLLTRFELWSQFHLAYLESAVAYAELGGDGARQMLSKFLQFSATSTAFAWFFWGSVGFSLLYARTAALASLRASRAIAGILLAAALYGVLRPGREVMHYLQLLVVPLSLLVGFSLAAANAATERERRGWAQLGPWIALLLIALAPQIYDRAVFWHRHVGYVREYLARAPHPTAVYLREHAATGDRVAMWGWDSQVLVDAGLPHGTRESHTSHAMGGWRMKPFYLARYIADLQANRPAWFIDVVGPGAFAYTDRGNFAHEAQPGLRELIAENYELVTEVGVQRVYRRREAPGAK